MTAGLDTENGLTNGGGHVPRVALFNENGDAIANRVPRRNKELKTGETKEFIVSHHRKNRQQPTYAHFISGGGNAVCISIISIQWPGGGKYSWNGDWGPICETHVEGGIAWYYSTTLMGSHKPACIWLDGDGTQPHTGTQIHWPEMEGKGGIPEGKDAEYFCKKGPPFKMMNNPMLEKTKPLQIWDPPLQTSRNKDDSVKTFDQSSVLWGILVDKRDVGVDGSRLGRRQQGESTPADVEAELWANVTDVSAPDGRTSLAQFLEDGLVIEEAETSPVPCPTCRGGIFIAHSAVYLCESESSLGPDFANIGERKFCRMSDKTLFDFCDDTAGITDNCWNPETKKLRVGGLEARGERYRNITRWN